MSFSCPHFDPANDWCDRVRAPCVCGRPGCVLAKNSVFATPVESRLPGPPPIPPPSDPPPPKPNLSLNK